jgi:hypothetical protein
VLCEYEDRDDPLTLDRICDRNLIKNLGLKSKGRRYTEALSGVLACQLLAAEKKRWVSYSRNRNWYPRKQRYYGPSFTYTYVVSAVDTLDRASLIEHERARPGSNRWQSRMRALPVLIEAGRNCTLNYCLREPLRLKDADGRLISYKETAQTLRLRGEVQRINRDLADFQIELPGVPRTAHHLLLSGNPILLTPRPCLHRVFLRKSWQCGGRAYGWWQSLPGEYRDQILLNGEPVTRPDYSALHGQLLYAQHGVAIDCDVYDVGCGFSRDEGKLGFQIALNARDRRTAVAAIAAHLGFDRPRAAALLDAVKRRNAPVADSFGRDLGVRLMRVDSDIILGCLATCICEGIPALPVHDELIVPTRYGSRAAEIMVETFEARVTPVSPCQVRINHE